MKFSAFRTHRVGAFCVYLAALLSIIGVLLWLAIERARVCDGLSFGHACGECGVYGTGCTKDVRGCATGYYGELCNYVCRTNCLPSLGEHCIERADCSGLHLYLNNWYE
jgi:hypothetical protein